MVSAGRLAVQVKREAGANPARSRHCKRGARLQATGPSDREGLKSAAVRLLDKSGDLPVAVHGRNPKSRGIDGTKK